MDSTTRLKYAQVLAKEAMMGKVMQIGEKVGPNLLRNAWSNMGTGQRIGAGLMGAGAAYGGYRMLRPSPNHGMLGRIQQATTNENSDLSQIYQGFNGTPPARR